MKYVRYEDFTDEGKRFINGWAAKYGTRRPTAWERFRFLLLDFKATINYGLTGRRDR